MDVNARDFSTAVIERSRSLPVVVDFWAPWCGPCRTLGPILDKLAAEGAGRWELRKLNTDENQALAQEFRIQGIPAVKAFVDGKVVSEFVGAQPEPQVRAWLEGFVPNEAQRLAREAGAAAGAGDTPNARRLYDEALARDPHLADALLFRARAALAEGDRPSARRALDALRPADASKGAALRFALEAPALEEARAAFRANPDDLAARYGVGLALAAGEQWEDALDAFLSIVKADRAWNGEAGRKAMLQVFDAIGIRSPIAERWRSKLSMELYR